MPTWALILIVVGAAILLLAVAFAAWTAVQRGRLRDRFGPEYDHSVETSGGRWRAERDLRQRERRHDRLDIRPLPPQPRARYAGEWRAIQSSFVDTPSQSVGQAQALVTEVLEAMGYPMGDFSQREAVISVDHPRVIENYRAAHAISLANDRSMASTEDLRQAMVHYRSLFDELLAYGEAATAPPPPDEQRFREAG